MIKDLFAIQVILSVNATNHVMLEKFRFDLDFENCKCRKNLVDKLTQEWTESVKEVKLAKITSSEDESKHKYSSCTLYIILILILLIQLTLELVLILFLFIGT